MTKLYKPMLPTLVEQIPLESEWRYEVKYDGFRCLLYITQSSIKLISRNLNDLSNSFPEIVASVLQKLPLIKNDLPIIMDGELIIFESLYRADFEKIQLRGRTKNDKKVETLMVESPASYCAFDLIVFKGTEIMKEPFELRKQKLAQVFHQLGEQTQFPQALDRNIRLHYVPATTDIKQLWNNIQKENGEGVIAKRLNSFWQEGVRTPNWLKIKNWKVATFFILSLDKKNGYFNVGLVKDQQIKSVGLFTHGLSSDERQALNQIVRNNSIKEDSTKIYINPSICVDLKFLDWYTGELRQPRFSKFRLDQNWEECTWEKAQNQSMN